MEDELCGIPSTGCGIPSTGCDFILCVPFKRAQRLFERDAFTETFNMRKAKAKEDHGSLTSCGFEGCGTVHHSLHTLSKIQPVICRFFFKGCGLWDMKGPRSYIYIYPRWAFNLGCSTRFSSQKPSLKTWRAKVWAKKWNDEKLTWALFPKMKNQGAKD